MASVEWYVLFSHSNVNVTGAWAKLPLLVPTLSYNFENAVECLDTDGRTEPIKVNCVSELRCVGLCGKHRVSVPTGTGKLNHMHGHLHGF